MSEFMMKKEYLNLGAKKKIFELYPQSIIECRIKRCYSTLTCPKMIVSYILLRIDSKFKVIKKNC